ncbi:uncharacterized protein LOC134250514 [Saccostrea cucullata]|uniref:uncharacterized protein LOC134250514 n=1 Tax=Saccostrea cuccullata TaxID=36930 RepID=UPI002ED5BBD5
MFVNKRAKMEVQKLCKNTTEHSENKDCVTYSVGGGLKQGIFNLNVKRNTHRIKLLICVFSLCVSLTLLLCITYILIEIFDAEAADANRQTTCRECEILTSCGEEEGVTEYSTRDACCRRCTIFAYTYLISLITSQKLMYNSSSGHYERLLIQASPNAELRAEDHLRWVVDISIPSTEFQTEMGQNSIVFEVPESGWYSVESVFQMKSKTKNSNLNLRHSIMQVKNKNEGNISRVLLQNNINLTEEEMAYQSTHLSALFWLDIESLVYPLHSNLNLLYNAKSCDRFTMYFVHD